MTKIWTNDEIEFLRQKYALLGSLECSKILSRTQEAVRMKAFKLGIKSPRSKKLTNEEYDNKLLEIESDSYRVGNYVNDRTNILHECLNNHQWLARPHNILRGSGCPTCAKRGIDFTIPAILYFVSFEYKEQIFYKIGITNRTVKERLKDDWNRLRIKELWSVSCTTGRDAHSIDQYLKQKNAAYLIDTGALVSGNTETFSVFIDKP